MSQLRGEKETSSEGSIEEPDTENSGFMSGTLTPSSQFSSPALQPAARWDDEEAALLAMEAFVVQGVDSLLEELKVTGLEQVPRKLIRYTEIIAQQGQTQRLWKQLEEIIRHSLDQARITLIGLPKDENFLDRVCEMGSKYITVLSILAKVIFLVAGSDRVATRLLSANNFCDSVLQDEQILGPLAVKLLMGFDLVLRDDSTPKAQQQTASLSAFSDILSGSARQKVFEILTTEFAAMGGNLILQHRDLNASVRPDKLLLKQCRLVTYWMRSVWYYWETIGISKFPDAQDQLKVIELKIIQSQKPVWNQYLSEALSHKNQRALKSFFDLAGRHDCESLRVNNIIDDALSAFGEKIAPQYPSGVVVAALAQRLHYILARCKLKDFKKWIEPTWMKFLTSISLDPGKFGESLAISAFVEIIAASQDPTQAKDALRCLVRTGEFIGLFGEPIKQAFLTESGKQLKTLLVPRPDGKTVSLNTEFCDTLVEVLTKVDDRAGHGAEVMLSDYKSSQKICGSNSLVCSRGFWHFDYTSSTVAACDAKKHYEAAFEGREVSISQSLSSVAITIGTRTLFVTFVQRDIISMLNGCIRSLQELEATPFTAKEVREALEDLISYKLVVWYSQQPSKGFQKSDVFALSSGAEGLDNESMYMFRLRILSAEDMEDD